MIRKAIRYGLKNVHKVRRTSQLVRKDVSTAVGEGMQHSGNLAKRMGFRNLSAVLYKNKRNAKNFAYKHPVKVLTGGVGAVGLYKYLRNRKKKRNK